MEQQQAEDARIVGAISADPDTASAKLRFLIDTHLITDEPTCLFILHYLQTRPGGQGVGVVPTDQSANAPPAPQSPQSPAAASPPAPPPPVVSGNSVTVESGWLPGGHNQLEVCGRLMADVQAQHQGRSVKLVDTSEDVRKDIAGQVTYNYRCDFDIN